MFSVFQMAQSSVSYIYAIRDEIDLEPSYQRAGDIWNLRKRQLLIDSLINGYDVPKFYFHALDEADENYSVIDGKQRLQSIWNFLDGKYPLASDFTYLRDSDIDMSGMYYSEIAKTYPRVRAKFDSVSLPIYCIRTTDEEIIEEMFTRLNEGSPLNAAEKRNAFGGPIPEVIRNLAGHEFFTNRLPFPDSRYRYYDIACKLLYLEHMSKVVDTKKIHLDSFVLSKSLTIAGDRVSKVLDLMCEVFGESDDLLSASGIIPVYYVLFRVGRIKNYKNIRKKLLKFENDRKVNRVVAKDADDFSDVDLDLLEFDRLMQSPNDSNAIQFRVQITGSRIGMNELTFENLKSFPEQDFD